MKKYFLYYLVAVLFTSCGVNNRNISVLKKIHKSQSKCQIKNIPNSDLIRHGFKSLRKEVIDNFKDSISLMDCQDVYIIESYNIEDGGFIGRIWNKKFDIRYRQDIGNKTEIISGKDKNNSLNVFFDSDIKYMCSLIEQWDVGTIKDISAESKVLGGLNYLATYLKKRNGNFEISCISFYEFPLEYMSK